MRAFKRTGHKEAAHLSLPLSSNPQLAAGPWTAHPDLQQALQQHTSACSQQKAATYSLLQPGAAHLSLSLAGCLGATTGIPSAAAGAAYGRHPPSRTALGLQSN
eukprot:1158325-Pelagomonas_calceolata.AAC.4